MEMEIRPLKTDSDIEEYIRKHYGSVEDYLSRRNEKAPLPVPKHEVMQKSAPEIFLGLCEAKAKSLGMSLEELFKRYPGTHRQYNELVTGDY